MIVNLFAKYKSALLFTILCLFHFYSGIIPGWNKIVSDFPNYYISSIIIAEGKDAGIMYNDSLFNVELINRNIFVQGQFSLYPPATAFIMLPLSSFSPITAKRIWLIFCLFLIPATIILIMKLADIGFFYAGNVLLSGGYCLTNDLMLGQVYLMMLFFTLLGFYLVKKHNTLSGSLFYGIVMSLKYYTFILGLVGLLRKKIKPMLFITGWFVLFNLVCLYFTGIPVYVYFIENIFARHLRGEIIGQTAYSVLFQSAESLFNRLFVEDPILNPTPFYPSYMLFYIFKTLFYLIPISFSFVLLYKAKSHVHFEEIATSVLLTLLLLLEPGSATYHLLLLVIPLVLLNRLFKDCGKEKILFWLVGLFACIGFLSVICNKIASQYNLPILLQYNRLWMLGLFFIVMMTGLFKALKHEDLTTQRKV